MLITLRVLRVNANLPASENCVKLSESQWGKNKQSLMKLKEIDVHLLQLKYKF